MGRKDICWKVELFGQISVLSHICWKVELFKFWEEKIFVEKVELFGRISVLSPLNWSGHCEGWGFHWINWQIWTHIVLLDESAPLQILPKSSPNLPQISANLTKISPNFTKPNLTQICTHIVLFDEGAFASFPPVKNQFFLVLLCFFSSDLWTWNVFSKSVTSGFETFISNTTPRLNQCL